MADSKLICPECDAVLRFPRPIPPGKPVQCPECDSIFKAPAEKTSGSRVKSAPSKSKPKAPAAPPPKKGSDKAAGKKPVGKPSKSESKPAPAADDDEDKTYGVVSDEVKEENKPKINYAPDTSIRDLRGPAQALIMKPTNHLLVVGAIGFIGWVALTIILLIPIVFPISTDEGTEAEPRDVLEVGDGLGCISGQFTESPGSPPNPFTNADPNAVKDAIDKAMKIKDPGMDAARKETVLLLFGMNLALVANFNFLFVLLLLFLLGFCAVFSGVVAVGASKAQNMESRAWGITASIMAMMPITTGGAAAVVMMLLSFLLRMVLDDLDFVAMIVNGVLGMINLAALTAGIRGLVVFNKEEVIAGFEYEPED